jgi:hypothetical protein
MLALALENFGVALSLTAGPAVALPVAEEALAIFRQIQAALPETPASEPRVGSCSSRSRSGFRQDDRTARRRNPLTF